MLNAVYNEWHYNNQHDMCNIQLQRGITPFRLAVEKERSKLVKYFVEEIKVVDITLYDQVIVYHELLVVAR